MPTRNYLKSLVIGPGGRRCTCCFPAPRSKARKHQFRRLRRVLARDLRQLICEATEV